MLKVMDVGASLGASQARLSQWLWWLRWVAIVAVAIVVVVTTTGDLYVSAAAVVPLWGGLLALVALNGVLGMSDAGRQSSEPILVAQLLVDVAVLGWMLHHAGGMANPLSGFFVFNAVIAAIVLRDRPARMFVCGLSLVILGLAALEANAWLPPVCLRDVHGGCLAADRLHLGAAGVAVAILVYVCPLFVLSLVNSLRRERSQLARLHAAVVEEREKLRCIIDGMADVVIFAGTDGAVRLHNQAALALWPGGVATEQSLHVCHTAQVWQHLLTRIAAPKPIEGHPLLVAHGRSYEATYAPVNGLNGSLSGVVMIARDVTDRLQQEQARVQNERLAVIGRLSASLAHEINNPLSAILLFTQHAQKQVKESDPLHAHLGTVKRNVDLCVKIVRDLLNYARRRDPERAPIDLFPLLEDAARTLSYKASRCGVEIHLTRDPEQPAVANVDRDQLLQVVLNLGLNAIETMDAGGTLSLHLVNDDAREVQLHVSDTGPGIAAEQREQIWDAFYTTKHGGTGLGLPIAKGIVEAHGGRITLTSELGQGTTFTVVVPRGELTRQSQPMIESIGEALV